MSEFMILTDSTAVLPEDYVSLNGLGLTRLSGTVDGEPRGWGHGRIFLLGKQIITGERRP